MAVVVLRPAAGFVLRNPKPTAIAAGLATLFAVVAGNAFYGQPGRHPHPMLVTRAETGASTTGSQLRVATNDPTLAPVPLVRELQEALAEAGYYASPVDGRPGPATEAAIKSFQSDNGLRVDGEPSPALLSRLHQDMASAAPVPQARSSAAGRGGRVAQSPTEETTGAIAAVVPSSRETQPAPAASSTAENLSEKELVRRIQEGLSAAQVASLDADGIAGDQTRAAIATFEALEGLEVTGAPRPQILKRLIEIGAVH
ncbi:peptidoglycan-binding domain-containing protein [Consotaella salsifontis]|uniref:peptidoglycan-binding domain-containing protein n=1 Tax=Consotaella salsifontis TaxID=1365950 RepID=UPI0013F67EA6|nr:peptidoglycan-binding protein [Consotaella salsifontis]